MKNSTLRMLAALVGVIAAATAQAGKPSHHGSTPPRNTAPIVQLPPEAQPVVIPTAEAGPTVSLPPPRDNFYSTHAAARPSVAAQAPAPTVMAEAQGQGKPLRQGGEHGPVVELPQR